MKDKCGIFGIVSLNKDAISKTFFGLKQLQHRGQDGSGIGFIENNSIQTSKEIGLVGELEPKIENKESNMAIGHVRYATSSKKQCVSELQPLSSTDFLLVHNGNLPFCKNVYDTNYLKEFIEDLLKKGNSIEDSIIHLLESIPGVYNLLLLTDECIYAIKDRYGFRPLCIARNDHSICIVSESCALNDTYNVIKEVEPGEIIKITKHCEYTTLYRYESNIVKTVDTLENSTKQIQPNAKFCMFENIYFMKPSTVRYDKSVYDTRFELGMLLAKQETWSFDSSYVVIGVPSSGIASGHGYSTKLNLEYSQKIVKNKKSNRSFIEPTQEKRINVLKNKFTLLSIPEKIIVIDDTIVRGNTMKQLVSLLYEKGAKEIHIRIPAPIVKNECYFGVDIASKTELLSYNRSIEDMRHQLNVSSLAFITNIEKYYSENNYCLSCFKDNNLYNELLDW